MQENSKALPKLFLGQQYDILIAPGTIHMQEKATIF
jgi:hypothetical protein